MSSGFPDNGKVPASFLESVVYPQCGASRPEVRSGPRTGVDTALIDLPGGHALALTTDPCSLIPSLGMKESAWLTVHLPASDIATTGFAPMYALFDLNLPADLSADLFADYWHHVHRFCEELGCAIVGGHTGRFPGQHATVAGGAMMATVAPRDELLTSSAARDGDRLIVAGVCGLAATAILARSFPETVRAACGDLVLERASASFWQTSAVTAALTAVSAGRGPAGVTAMHDVTEGGVCGALWELAQASGCGLQVDLAQIPTTEPVRAIATTFGLDPLRIVSSGALVVAVAPACERAVLAALHARRITASVVGELTPADAGHIVRTDGHDEPLVHTGEDPYWRAYQQALTQGLR